MAGASSAATTPGLAHQTVRNIICTSAGGSSLRVRVSNADDEAATACTTPMPSWLFAAELDVRPVTAGGTVVAFGGTVTDGYHSQIGADGRWPNYLARRLAGLTDPASAR